MCILTKIVKYHHVQPHDKCAEGFWSDYNETRKMHENKNRSIVKLHIYLRVQNDDQGWGCRISSRIIRRALPDIAEYPASGRKIRSGPTLIFFPRGLKIYFIFFILDRVEKSNLIHPLKQLACSQISRFSHMKAVLLSLFPCR